MTATILRFVLDHWRETLLVALLFTAIAGIRGCVQERDARIRQEAVANERLVDLEASNARADSLDKVHARTDSQVAVAQAHISQLRQRADSLAHEAEADAREASIRLAEAGDSLAATLDSLHSVVPPDLRHLTGNARRQHAEEREAQRDVSEALSRQLAATVQMREAADSTARLRERRYGSLEDAYEARGRALERAREALEVRVPEEGGRGIGRDLVAAGVGAGLYLLVDQVVVPLVGGT